MRSGFRFHFSTLGLVVIFCLCSVGTIRAFTRGANDFNVFYEAWKLVLGGHGLDIYRVSPDRYLYSPGFAWLLSPIGFLSRPFALGLWCLVKTLWVGYVISALSGPWFKNQKYWDVLGVSAWGVVLMARPLLIDFEYGQVNLIILGACLLGLNGHFKQKSSMASDFIKWSILTGVAIAKLFPLPLLLVPWLVKKGISNRKLKIEKGAIFFGLIVALFIPLVTENWAGLVRLMIDWRDAILSRGLPLESHNQSFTALLHHYLSGHPTPVISEGGQALLFGQSWLSPSQISSLSLFWTCSMIGLMLGWMISGDNHQPYRWVAVLVGFLIIPSHLVWKPYFVMSVPLAVLLAQQVNAIILGRSNPSEKGLSVLSILFLFAGINLTGFDFLGHHWAAQIEAASFLLVTHLVMLFLVMKIDFIALREKSTQVS